MTPSLPKLRPVDVRWVNHRGMPMIVLNDPLRLRRGALLVPQAAGPLLALMDGTRDLAALQAGFLHYTGARVDPREVEALVNALDEAFLLDNERFRQAKAAAIEIYRRAPFREPSIAGGGYPANPAELRRALDQYCREAAPPPAGSGDVAGVISPHIDFARGWRTYAHTWLSIKRAVQEAELIILLGTDHAGSPGTITLTRQSYATPWGVLPTDVSIVDRLAGALGEDAAFAEEHHHLGEHSIELASVWLHYVAEGQPKRVLPVLCGQHELLLMSNDAAAQRAWEAMDVLAKAASQQRTLIVAAGDLSHVGPAFGDQQPYDDAAKAHIRASDERYLKVASSGQSEALKDYLILNGDPTRICGAAPIHYMVHLLGGASGDLLHYDQCPADDAFASLVSIAGVAYGR